MTVLMLLRVLHVLAAAGLVGSVIFNYFLLRPALRLIPPASAVVVAQRVGNAFTILGWSALGLLVLSGALRLYLQGLLGALLTLHFYTTGYGRWIAVMILAWLVTLGSSAIMTFSLRPTLLRKLPIQPNPGLADVEKRRQAQVAASTLMERLQLVTVIAATLALVAGASVMFGGFF